MNSQTIKNALRRLDVSPSKGRGQNFLVDPQAIETIINFAKVEPGSALVEIGPGLGALTDELVDLGPLTVIELERSFATDLSRKYPSITVINKDVLAVNFASLPNPCTVFGNLPYSLSTDIVLHLIASYRTISKAVLLLQREFAERLAAKPGGRDYGRLSVVASLWADMRLGPVITAEAFHPVPMVESRLVELLFLSAPRVEIGDPKHFERVVKASFSKRRKMLHNSLSSSGFFDSAQVNTAFEVTGIDSKRRAETLTLDEFAQLAAALQVGPKSER